MLNVSKKVSPVPRVDVFENESGIQNDICLVGTTYLYCWQFQPSHQCCEYNGTSEPLPNNYLLANLLHGKVCRTEGEYKILELLKP